MRRVIYPLVKDGIKPVRPAEGQYVNDDIETRPGYVIADYEGSATEAELPTYVEPVVRVNLVGVRGVGFLEQDGDRYVVQENTELVVDIEIDLAHDTTLTIPMQRADTGRLVYGRGVVTRETGDPIGTASLTFRLPTSGQWSCTKALLDNEARSNVSYEFSGVRFIAVLPST